MEGRTFLAENSRGYLPPALGDVNGDGFEDLVAVVEPIWPSVLGGLMVALGSGDGTLGRPQFFPAGSSPTGVALADLDGDGDLDAAVSNWNAGEVSVLLGSGAGSFEAPVAYPVGKLPNSVATWDLSGDGVPDLVVTHTWTSFSEPGVGMILLGKGDGTFHPGQVIPGLKNTRGASAGDLDGDGILDLAFANLGLLDVGIVLGLGGGAFGPMQAVAVGSGQSAVGIGDFDADGLLDLATALPSKGELAVLPGLGDGTFGPDSRLAAVGEAESMVVGDIDGDGIEDLAMGMLGQLASPAGAVSVFLGSPFGAFTEPLRFATGERPGSVSLADLDGDGRVDLCAASWHMPSGVFVLLSQH
jgi:hypothetical protein